MKKLIFLALCVYLPVETQAQFPYTPGNQTEFKQFSFHVKKHTDNRTTPQLDTLKVGGGGVASDTLWTLIATAQETSRVYITSPYMSLWQRWQAASTDSAGIRAYLYMATEGNYAPGKIPGLSDFALIDSTDITRTGTQERPKFWIITASARPNFRWMFFILKGTASNTIRPTGTVGRIKLSTFSDLPK